MTEHWFKWALDENGKPWVVHQCLTLTAWKLPPQWRMENGVPFPSLDCTACGCHVYVKPEDEVTMAEVDEALEARRG